MISISDILTHVIYAFIKIATVFHSMVWMFVLSSINGTSGYPIIVDNDQASRINFRLKIPCF